jgi:Heparinase II/III-like protein/Heparinase II/III N-terminus
MRRLRLLAYLLRYFGVRWVVHRVRFAAQRRAGVFARRERFLDVAPATWLRRLAGGRFETAAAYATYRRTEAPRFLVNIDHPEACRALFARWDEGGRPAGEQVEQIRAGRFTYFGHTTAQIGCPPDWHRNPFTGAAAPRDVHWSRIDERALGDIKVIWEPSRFAWVYPLVRQHGREGDGDAAELFWQLLEDWNRANPPGLGVNWRCAQEIGIRAMACAFALNAFRDARATTPERIVLAGRLMWTCGHRIALDLDDALSQQNNHGITAAAGLFTIGVLFPEFPESAGWADEGRRTLERLGRDLIYDDGSFVQHSLNYQRLMLHDYVWAFALAARAGLPLTDILRDRVRRSAELLWRLQDETTGSVPQYGHCDGALILPLDNCDALDFRPVTQAAAVLLDGVRWWPEGPWDEDLLWLFGLEALQRPVRIPVRDGVSARDGGYFALRGDETWAMTRCGAFRHRPGQPDMLHVDLWWRGHNVAIDAGTFSYSEGGEGEHALAGTAAHNTVTVDGADQMDRCGRFLWFPWITGRVLQPRRPAGETEYWEGEHDGYRPRGVRHRRGILRIASSAWLIIDRLESRRRHSYRLHWLLPDGPHAWDEERLAVDLRLREGNYVIQVATAGAPAAGELVRAAADGSGWRSRYYYSREPALSLAVKADAATALFATLLAPAPASVRIDAEQTIQVTAGGRIYRITADGAIAGAAA